MNIIEARNITRMFPVGDGEFYALKHVDIDIPAGKLTILKGRSGSGKTTLMNILSALDAPTEGDVSFDGQVYSGMEEAQKEQLREPELTAKEVDERIRETLALVGMEERMRHMPGQMSGGEQQRVAIARAVAHRPKVVFADEPTGALDTESGLRVMQLFRNLIEKEGVTIVMTTHDPNLMELGDVVYELEDGEIIDRQIRE